ncbi:MAG: polysaccharide deacetylase family protein [Candidatus Hodarchaeota archaeon]
MKKYGSISIDIDPLWHYLEVRDWKPKEQTKLNTIYDDAIPRLLDLFGKHNIKATFFIVGKDALLKRNSALLRKISDMGHEIANHTMNHVQNFIGLSKEEKENEIKAMDELVTDIIGKKIVGFRAPGWNIDNETIEILEKRNYLYDSSVFPSSFVPFMKIAHFIKNRGRGATCFGRPFYIFFAPRLPYSPHHNRIWAKGNRKIQEFPISVLPFLRFPFFGTLVYFWGVKFFNLSYRIFKLRNSFLNYELHGLDLADFTDINDERLRVKSGITLKLETKIHIWDTIFSKLANDFELIPICRLLKDKHF